MENDSTMTLLLLEAATTLLTTEVRKQIHRFVGLLELRLFLLEMMATFQLCACFSVLSPLVDVEPIPQLYLTHIYSFSTFHFYLTLTENTSNPASTLVYILHKGISMRLGGLKIVAQFIGAFLARIYQNALWIMGISNLHIDPYTCSNPLQTYLFKAVCTELITSVVYQFTLLKSQAQDLRVRANVLSLTITSLVYAGGKLTGAIFNPALAFSLHISCFMDNFWNYMLVYWVAPCIGSVLVVIAWDDVLPLLRREA